MKLCSIALGALLSLAGVAPAFAQAGPAPTVLIVDASNSMWARIEGRAKHEIARDAVANLLGSLPKSARIGLVAYGHRRAGDCKDIETLLSVGTLDKARVEGAVARLVPRGKTPITASLREAAALVPQGGTVVLVTDGIETCNADPCAVAEEMKRQNAGLVAHVVGFDLPTASERAKVSCIAERTGGTFVAAMNARELGDGLRMTAQAKAKPVVATRSLILEATDGGRAVPDAAFTVIRGTDGAVVMEGRPGSVSLPPGRYRFSAVAAGKSGQAEAEIGAAVPEKVSVALTGILPKASLQPVKASVPATSLAEVRWTGPNASGDYISLARPNGDPLETRHYSYTKDGNPVKVRVPGEPGEYELRYVSDATGAILARARITAAPVTATLTAPATGTAGSSVSVSFTGPNADEDWVGLAKPGAEASSYEQGVWQYATQGSPASLRLPAEPGTYEIRYVSGLDPKVLAKATITVGAAKAGLSAPARGMAGTLIPVRYTGEGEGDTFIGIVRKGAAPSDYIGGAYERPQGGEVSLRLPAEPGAYEVRFVLEANGDYKVLASVPLTVDPAQASVTGPDRVRRGTSVTVSFTGPLGDGDFVTIVPTGAAPDAYESYVDARQGTASGTLEAPAKAGAYELRYVMGAPGETGAQVIARRPIRVE
ncbi:MAG TPA: VWA domain-containing protein [Microvirga sp.]|jgi:Ca-activated chloride channel family protein